MYYRESEYLKAVLSLTESVAEETCAQEALEKWHEDLMCMPYYRLACLVHALQNYLLAKVESELVKPKTH